MTLTISGTVQGVRSLGFIPSAAKLKNASGLIVSLKKNIWIMPDSLGYFTVGLFDNTEMVNIEPDQHWWWLITEVGHGDHRSWFVVDADPGELDYADIRLLVP